MKYNIKIMSRKKCIDYSKDIKEKTIIISINDSNNSTEFYSNPNIVDILSLNFDDIESNVDGCILNNSNHNKLIKDFIDIYKEDIYNIVVHCTMGVSRSGAVGMILARYLNDSDYYLWKKGIYNPNKFIYKNMCDTFGLVYSEKDFKRKEKISEKVCRKRLCGEFSKYGIDFDDMFNVN